MNLRGLRKTTLAILIFVIALTTLQIPLYADESTKDASGLISMICMHMRKTY